MPDERRKDVILPKSWDGAGKITPVKAWILVIPTPDTAASTNPEPPTVERAPKFPLVKEPVEFTIVLPQVARAFPRKETVEEDIYLFYTLAQTKTTRGQKPRIESFSCL
jgi:hypothetical protein